MYVHASFSASAPTLLIQAMISYSGRCWATSASCTCSQSMNVAWSVRSHLLTLWKTDDFPISVEGFSPPPPIGTSCHPWLPLYVSFHQQTSFGIPTCSSPLLTITMRGVSVMWCTTTNSCASFASGCCLRSSSNIRLVLSLHYWSLTYAHAQGAEASHTGHLWHLQR